jgi:hypothetical protein
LANNWLISSFSSSARLAVLSSSMSLISSYYHHITESINRTLTSRNALAPSRTQLEET